MKTTHETLALLDSDAPLAPLTDSPFEPGAQQRALLRRIVADVIDPMTQVTLAPGAAGTGKTTMIRILLRLLLACSLRVVVAAPTHKARARVQETLGSLGVEVVTHHRLWCGSAEEAIEEGEEYADDLSLGVAEDRLHDYDVVVVDEASMLTEEDLGNLLSVLRPSCTVIGTGDHHQLPPVGGAPGFDWSNADEYGLTEVYRQAGGSPVLEAVTAIREQRVPFTWSRVADWKTGGAILRQAGVPSRWAGSDETGYGLAQMIRRNGGGLGSAVAVVGTHASRVRVADATRRHLGHPSRSYGPAIGERVVAMATAGGLSNATTGIVTHCEAQDFGSRVGAGWIVTIECEDGRSRTVGVLAQSWLQTDRASNRGKIPYSIRMMLESYAEEDAVDLRATIAEAMLARETTYLAAHEDAEEVPGWLVDRWRAEECAKRGAWGPWLAQRLAAIDTAYAITCHASQGSQWQEVIVVADCVDFIARDHATGTVDADGVYRWSYTALSRAVSSAVVVTKSQHSGDWGEPPAVTGVEIGTASRDWQARSGGRRR
jgi:hypothetical protein